MDTVNNTANCVGDMANRLASSVSKEAKRNVAKDSTADGNNRASARKYSTDKKVYGGKIKASAEDNKQACCISSLPTVAPAA